MHWEGQGVARLGHPRVHCTQARKFPAGSLTSLASVTESRNGDHNALLIGLNKSVALKLWKY